MTLLRFLILVSTSFAPTRNIVSLLKLSGNRISTRNGDQRIYHSEKKNEYILYTKFKCHLIDRRLNSYPYK